ncbi:MAG: caspase family protein [Bacteroidetes bacterium]|nr:caspase family protein [Bacteroidota bacterium]MDF1867598.1 caspase family protein [Saprospiraceae bacterium]
MKQEVLGFSKAKNVGDAAHQRGFLTPQKLKKYIGKWRSYSLVVTKYLKPMMRIYLVLLLWLYTFSGFAQEPDSATKGVKPMIKSGSEITGITRAIIFGISDYQDDEIPDLRFADKDARIFSDYLKSEAGGALSEDFIQLKTNEQATTAEIASSLDWLLEESVAGDVAIIYFSGHSDVETKFKTQNGYLITFNSPPRVYAGGAFPLFILNQYISALSESGVQVIMISDACHSGKLAGSSNGGTQAASAGLAKQFNKEIKILSCQPDEFSLEGRQWGGGRGVFSFFLIDGLYGLADNNGDLQVSLLELGRYLEDNIPAETAPLSQLPMTVGNRNTVLAKVDERLLQQRMELKKESAPSMSFADNKGLEERVLEKAPPSIREGYVAFKAAMSAGRLMSPEGSSANDYYEQLSKEKSLQPLHNLMRRNLAVALQDEVQERRNKLLKSDTSELALVNDGIAGYYEHLPNHVARAAELLGEKHYMYAILKGWQNEIRGYVFLVSRPTKRYKEVSFNSIRKSIPLFKKAILFQGENALDNLLLSEAYRKLNMLDSAFYFAKKAIKYSPTWAMGYKQISQLYLQTGQFFLSKRWSKKGNSVQKMNFFNYSSHGYLLFAQAFHNSEKQWNSWRINSYSYSGKIPYRKRKFEEALKWYEQSIQSFPNANAFYQLGWGNIRTGNREAGEDYLLKAIETQPYFIKAYRSLVTLYGVTKQETALLDLLTKMENTSWGKPEVEVYETLSIGYLLLKDYKKFRQFYQKAIRIEPATANFQYEISRIFALNGDSSEALNYLEKALVQGYSNRRDLRKSPDFNALRTAPSFKKLVNKYRKSFKLN